MKQFLASMLSLSVMASAMAAEPEVIQVKVTKLSTPPVVDGKADEWGSEGWQKARVLPALEHDEQNVTGELDVEFKAGVTSDRFYLVARWPDKDEDRQYKTWKWSGNKYRRGKERDDMFAVRFHMDGDYDKCMLAPNTYRVDVWLWSAGRSDLASLAEDFSHIISSKPLEDAAEYTLPNSNNTMVYIQKPKDQGPAIVENTQAPTAKEADEMLGTKISSTPPTGSIADVTAKGNWANGHWIVEFSRKLDTGQTDDVSFLPARKIKSALAVFNKGYAEHKSTTAELVFDFTGAM